MGKNVYNRKKGYRYEQKKKKINRDVLSYEDMPLEDYDKESAEISKPAVKKILILIAGIVLLGLIVFAVANRENLTPEKITRWVAYDLLGASDDGYPVTIQGTNVNEGNFICDGNEVCYVSDTVYQSLASNGNEIGYSQISFSNPVMVTSGDYVLIYDLGGHEYVTGTKERLNDVRKTESEIFTADINSKGDYCLVTKADGYLSKAFAYNKYNEKHYAYSFADYYVTAVAMNDNGSGLTACGISGKNGSMATVAYVLEFSSEKPKATHSLGENVVYSVEYLNSNTPCIVGSNASFVINVKRDELKKVDYNQMMLTTFDIDKDTSKFVISLSRSGDGNQCSLEYIGADGKVINTNKTNHGASSVSIYKNRIAVLDGNNCYLYDTEGNKIGKKDAGNGAKVARIESTDSVYILGINEIRKLIDFAE